MTAPTPPESAIPGFHGRDAELAWLRGLFEEVAETRVPRLAVVVAESGIGKTRLVQALYQQLTVDPAWDPADHDYWPDAFQGDGDSLRVNPELSNHVPQGPPRFMWLGMRWHPTDERNLNERVCPLPEARDALQRHHELARRQLPFWKELLARGGDAVGDLTIETLTDAGAEALGIPGFNILKAGFKTVTETLSDRSKGLGHHDAVQHGHQDAGEAFIELLSKLCGGSTPLPTVLWLDDAQWIDSVTLQMLGPLFEQARRRRWPLLVVATHWEREWREGLRERRDLIRTSLADFASHDFAPSDEDKGDGGGETTTQVRVLEHGANPALRATLRDRLPGLTDDQQALLVEKAAGNFLTMVENIGELRKSSKLFLDRDFARPLSDKGIERVRHWESDRERRVQQRFDDLEEDVRDLLGWGSHIGQRFIAEVVGRFAESRQAADARSHLADCVDPGAILAEPNPHLREFRDRAFHRVAARYFDNMLRDGDEDDLTAILRDHLATWVNACFDDDGELLASPNDPDLEPETPTAPEASIMALQVAERLDLLRIAIKSLPMSDPPAWANETDRAAIRSHSLWLINHGLSKAWNQVTSESSFTQSIEWNAVPANVISRPLRELIAEFLDLAGSHASAYPVLASCLESAKEETPDTPMDDLIRRASMWYRLSDIGMAMGDIRTSHSNCERSLDLWSMAKKREESETILDGEIRCLERLADVCIDQGDHEQGRAWLTRILKYTSDSTISPEKARTIEARCHLISGCLYLDDSRLEEAVGHLQKCVETRRLHLPLDTTSRKRSLKVAESWLAEAFRIRGDLSRARDMFQAGLRSACAFAEETKTPGARRDIAYGKVKIAMIEREVGNLTRSSKLLEESLALNRELAEETQSPFNRRDALVSLERIATTHEAEGRLSEAGAMVDECINQSIELAREVDIPLFDRDLAVGLHLRARIFLAKGEYDKAHIIQSDARDAFARLSRESPALQHDWDLASCLLLGGKIDIQRGNAAGASVQTHDALAILERLIPLTDSPRIARDHAVALLQAGRIHAERNELKDARNATRQSLDIRKQVSHDLDTPESKRDVAVAMIDLAQLDFSTGALSASEDGFRGAASMLHSLVGGIPEWKIQHDLAVALLGVGDVACEQERFSEAANAYEKAAIGLASIEAADPTPEIHSLAQVLELRMVDVEILQDDWEGALSRCEKLIAATGTRTNEEVSDLNPSIQILALNRLSGIQSELERDDHAVDTKRSEMAIAIEAGSSAEIRETYASAIDIAEAAGDHEQAEAWRAELAALGEADSGTTPE